MGLAFTLGSGLPELTGRSSWCPPPSISQCIRIGEPLQAPLLQGKTSTDSSGFPTLLPCYRNAEFKPRPRTLWVLEKGESMSPGLGTEQVVLPAAHVTMTGDSKDLIVHL